MGPVDLPTLRQIGNLAGPHPRRNRLEILTVQAQRTLRREDARQSPQETRLACTVRSDKGHEFSGRDVERPDPGSPGACRAQCRGAQFPGGRSSRASEERPLADDEVEKDRNSEHGRQHADLDFCCRGDQAHGDVGERQQTGTEQG